jgi:hypothetical protein
MTPHRVAIGILVVVAAAMLSGCGPDRRHEPDWPGPRAQPVRPGPEFQTPPPPPPQEVVPVHPPAQRPDVVTGFRPPLKGQMSDAEKQRIIEQTLLNLQRLIVSADERLVLSTGIEPSDAARNALTQKLAELGFKVIQSTSSMGASPSEGMQDAFRKANDCNIAIVVQGDSKKQDKFGNFWSFESNMNAKVLNLATHQVIASRTILKRGRRALDERQAAEDAQESAAKDLATYLTDEVVRKWEATSLVRVSMYVGNIDNADQADDLRVGLQARPGIYYVSLEFWDDKQQLAVYEVLCRFDVERFLTAYVSELRRGGIEIKRIERKGEVIDARRRHWQ